MSFSKLRNIRSISIFQNELSIIKFSKKVFQNVNENFHNKLSRTSFLFQNELYPLPLLFKAYNGE